MIFFQRKVLFFSFIWISIVFLCSCAQAPPYDKEINIFITPFKLHVHSGSVDKAYVEVLDKQGNPLAGLKIDVKSTHPAVAYVSGGAVTDANGEAVVFVYGHSPGYADIIFSAAGQTASMEIVFSAH